MQYYGGAKMKVVFKSGQVWRCRIPNRLADKMALKDNSAVELSCAK